MENAYATINNILVNLINEIWELEEKAIITEEAGLTSHAAIVGMNLGKSVFVGAKGIMDQLQDGDWVTIDFRRGVIYSGQAQVK